MSRCKATTNPGRQCMNTAMQGELFCSAHQNNVDYGEAIFTGIGIGIGNTLFPGIGGAIGGAIVGNMMNKALRVSSAKALAATKTKTFISFDFDNDKILKDFIVQQSRRSDSPFEFADHSLKEAAPEHNWESKARTAIRRSDIVIVMVGPYTYRARGVLKEVKIAREENKRIVQIIGYKNGQYNPVPGAGRLYRWNWPNLKNLLG